MTLIECQSPLKARSGGNEIPCKTEEELNEASSAKSSSSLPQRCLLGKYPPPFQSSFPFEECYSPTASCHSFPRLCEFRSWSNPSTTSVNKHSRRDPPCSVCSGTPQGKGKMALPSFQAEGQLNYHHPDTGERDFKPWGGF